MSRPRYTDPWDDPLFDDEDDYDADTEHLYSFDPWESPEEDEEDDD